VGKNAGEKLIVALDVENRDKALGLVKRLRSRVGLFKIGLQLYTSEGPEIVRAVIDQGAGIFLDLKFLDIPNTVAGAVAEAVKLNVFMVNVHASGGKEMMKKAVESAKSTADKTGIRAPILLAVTVLTSAECPADEVVRLACLAKDSGMNGIVCPGREISPVREACGPGFIIVTPGIRPSGAKQDDQSRVMTPGEAIKSGADYIVVGRPISQSADPAEAAAGIIEEMERAL